MRYIIYSLLWLVKKCLYNYPDYMRDLSDDLKWYIEVFHERKAIRKANEIQTER